MASLKLAGLRGAVPSALKAYSGDAGQVHGCQYVRRCAEVDFASWFYAGARLHNASSAGAEPRHFVSNFARLTIEASCTPFRNFAINGGQN